MFRLSRYGSASTSPPLIFTKDYYEQLHQHYFGYHLHLGYQLGIVISSYSFAIALITTWPYFCVTYPSRLALEYCRQHDLCTLVFILPIAYIPSSCCISWYHHLCHKVVVAYTIAILVREALHEKKSSNIKEPNKLLSKRGKISKELIRKNHSIIQD